MKHATKQKRKKVRQFAPTGGLYFGIPSLDGLIATADSSSETTSVTILGPDGTGKSVLAMHLAATYAVAAASDPRNSTRVFYVSTDLKHDKAQRVWENFALDHPLSRDIQFEPDGYSNWRRSAIEALGDLKVVLREVIPEESPGASAFSLARFLVGSETSSDPEVGFLDLASHSAGDDWGCLNRILALLRRGEGKFRHLMVVDSVAGFETLVGRFDAYGEETTRRARIAQIMRSASEDCHIIFVVEESREHEHLPEEYVTDVVVRLRRMSVRATTRRTIQIEKARARSHALGEHPFEIRESKRATEAHADEPECRNSYVQVFPALDHEYKGMAFPKARFVGRYAAFGIPYLDNMLGSIEKDKAGGRPSASTRVPEPDRRGLPAGTLTALIGDAGTRKTPLGFAFLSQCFSEYVKWATDFLEMSTNQANFVAHFKNAKELRTVVFKPRALFAPRVSQIADLLNDPYFIRPAVLITTQEITGDELADKFLDWFWPLKEHHGPRELAGPLRRLIGQTIRKYIICRRIGVQDQPTPVLFHLIQRNLMHARRLFGSGRAWQIRVVIDDLQALRETYPDVREDPLFLPLLAHYLSNEGVSALIINTDSGRPDTDPTDKLDAELRTLAHSHLYTWRVHFYGEQRVAIAVIPPLSRSHVGVVRELESDPAWPQTIPKVLPHFELYTGLEHGRPSRVPLEVRLYKETCAFDDYVRQENVLFGELFVPRNVDRGVLQCESVQHFESVRDSCNIPTNVRLDHSLLFQIDGFWALGDRAALQNQFSYLNGELAKDDVHADPLKLFQPTRRAHQKKRRTRLEFFNNLHYLSRISPSDERIDRVPFMWDFGFLMCAAEPWKRARNNRLPTFRIDGAEVRVGDVWDAMPKVTESGAEKNFRSDPRLRSWRAFLEACQVVAQVESLRTSTKVRAFDIAMLSPDDMACLVLEVWASEIEQSVLRGHPGSEFWQNLDISAQCFPSDECIPGGAREDLGLVDLLREPTRSLGDVYGDRSQISRGALSRLKRFSLELYKTWLLLVDVLDMPSYLNPGNPFVFQLERLPAETAIAARHWYKTACLRAGQTVNHASQLGETNHVGPLADKVPVRLPGNFSVRGDWYLAVAQGSRSSRLAHQAIDLLSSRRANLVRMQMGLGLPVRDVMPKEGMEGLRTRLVVRNNDLGSPRHVEYGELSALLPRKMPEFQWLWRSGLGQYDRHSRNWQKWIGRCFAESDRFRYFNRTNWVPGFQVYDLIEKKGWKELGRLSSHEIFGMKADQLIIELEQASRP